VTEAHYAHLLKDDLVEASRQVKLPVAKRAGEHVRALEESGQPVPRPRQASEMPTTLQAKIGRAMISVQVGRPVTKTPSSAID